MEKKNWFIPKPYGWGLVPTCWQGWLATLFYVVFVYLMEGKTEGKVRWYWGNTKKD